MKQNLRSFSFLMELVFMIFFFALASCVCVGLLAKAKEKETMALALQHDLLQAQSMIEKMQVTSPIPFEKRFQCERKDALTYQKDDLLICFADADMEEGYILLQRKGTTMEKLPFAIGGESHE